MANPVVARILEHAARCDGSPFLTLVDRHGGESTLSLAQLLARAETWRMRFGDAGLAQGDKVIVILEHGEALYTSFLGALLGGYCPAFFAHPSEKMDVTAYCASVRALSWVIEGDFLVTSRAIQARVKITQMRGIYEDGVSFETAGAAAGSAREPPAKAPLFLQFSSGTTGLKKAVGISAEALLWQVDAYAERIELKVCDRIASGLPLYHDMGLIACFFLPLLRGIPLAAISPFDWVRAPGLWFDVITRQRATLAWLPNFAFNFLAARAAAGEGQRWDLASLRAVVNCSEPVLDSSHQVFMRRFEEFGLSAHAISTCYAMAENTFAVTSGRAGAPLVREIVHAPDLVRGGHVSLALEGEPDASAVVSSGAPLTGVQVTIRDERRAELAHGHVGEICIAAPGLFSGYYGNRDETLKNCRNGVFFTGDLGYLRNNELFVIGRIKDTIIVAGRNIYPQDVEALIDGTEGAIPGRSVAFGVEDASLGTQGLVIVAETTLKNSDARQDLRKRLRVAVTARLDVAAADIVLAECMWLQKSTSGKLSRALNKQRYLEARRLDFGALKPASPGNGAQSVRSAVRECVMQSITASAGHAVPAFADDDDLVREGILDSFSVVGLQLTLEDRFGSDAVYPIRENFALYASVDAIAAVLTERPGPSDDSAAVAPQMRPGDGVQTGRQATLPQMLDAEAQPYEWYAYVMRRGSPNYHSPSLNSDEHGFRHCYRDGNPVSHTDYANAKEPRVAVLGNSFAYGIGVTHDSRTFASRLNDLPGSKAWFCYNFSQRASVLRQERLAFELFSPGLPARVVWISGINNLISLIVGEGASNNPAPFVGERHFAARMMPGSRYGEVPGSEERYQRMLMQLEVDISVIALRLQGKGRMLFCLQPSATWIDKAFTAEEEKWIANFDSAGSVLQQAHAPAYLAPLHYKFSDDVAAVCRRWNVGYLDCNLDPRLKASRSFFIDRTHMTDEGHALIAEMIVHWLQSENKFKRGLRDLWR